MTATIPQRTALSCESGVRPRPCGGGLMIGAPKASECRITRRGGERGSTPSVDHGDSLRQGW